MITKKKFLICGAAVSAFVIAAPAAAQTIGGEPVQTSPDGGTTQNDASGDLDMAGNDINNAGTVTADTVIASTGVVTTTVATVTVLATSGSFTGNVTAGNVIATNGTFTGDVSAANGTVTALGVQANTVSVGTINGGTATFTGDVSAVNGAYSGSLAAGSVTMNAGGSGRISGVSAGTSATDAVNLGQLQSGLSSTMASSNAYTDSQFAILEDRISNLDFDLSDTRRDAFAGTASALAVAGIPQTIEPGKTMIGGAVGHYRGQTAFAIGISSTFAGGNGVFKAGGTVDKHGKGGFNAGAGISF
jgi:hypothetical protein